MKKPFNERDEQTYKVRVAMELAHYLFVKARTPYEAEMRANMLVHNPTYDFEKESSHSHITFEVEETGYEPKPEKRKNSRRKHG